MLYNGWNAQFAGDNYISVYHNDKLMGSVTKRGRGWIATAFVGDKYNDQRKRRDVASAAAHDMWGNDAAFAVSSAIPND